MLSTLDIYPTILGLMGFENSIPDEVDGQNLADYLITGKGKKPTSQWYMRVSADPSYGVRGIRTDRYTFVIDQPNPKQKTMILFDRKTDPFQMRNIADENPEIVKNLNAELKTSLKKYDDPWLKNK